jgi:hypothetical protein
MKTILNVIGVLSGVTVIAGGIILVVVKRRLRDSSNAPQKSDVYSLTELSSKSDREQNLVTKQLC